MAACCANCAKREETTPAPEEGSSVKAIAELSPSEKSTVIGVVTFEETGGGLAVRADLTGLKTGLYRLSIHKSEDCRSLHPVATEGWNLGNFQPDDEGRAHVEASLGSGNLSKTHPDSVIAKAVIVESNDELGTQLACGMIHTGERDPVPIPALREGSGRMPPSP